MNRPESPRASRAWVDRHVACSRIPAVPALTTLSERQPTTSLGSGWTRASPLGALLECFGGCQHCHRRSPSRSSTSERSHLRSATSRSHDHSSAMDPHRTPHQPHVHGDPCAERPRRPWRRGRRVHVLAGRSLVRRPRPERHPRAAVLRGVRMAVVGADRAVRWPSSVECSSSSGVRQPDTQACSAAPSQIVSRSFLCTCLTFSGSRRSSPLLAGRQPSRRRVARVHRRPAPQWTADVECLSTRSGGSPPEPRGPPHYHRQVATPSSSVAMLRSGATPRID